MNISKQNSTFIHSSTIQQNVFWQNQNPFVRLPIIIDEEGYQIHVTQLEVY